MQTDRTLPFAAFPGDTGEACPQTRSLLALVTRDRTPGAYLRAVVALCADRLLVPVVATATRVGPAAGGLGSEKEAQMSVVSIRSDDGRRALLAFTGLDALEAWDARARPVPVTLDTAAQAALDDGDAALLVDLAGPDPLVIDDQVLAQLASGHRLVQLDGGGFGWVVPVLEPE